MNLLVFNLKTDADDDVLGFTTDWVNEIARHCTKVFVITMAQGRVAVADNVVVMSVGRERGYSEIRRALRFYYLLSKLLRSQRIDACFAHMMPLFAVMGWPLLAARRIPTVLWYAHGSVSRLLRVAVPIVDRVLTSSRTGFQLPSSKVRIIGQGIDTERFHPPSQRHVGTFNIVTVGRLSPIKNVHLLVEAVSLLRASHPDLCVTARIIGSPIAEADHRYTESVRADINRRGLSDYITIVPGRPFHEIHHEYTAADCFVNSSDTDSVDKTVLEAMSCGVPIITSNAAFKDILGPTLAAEWVIPKHNTAVLHNQLATLISMSDGARTNLGNALREIVVRDHSLPALGARIIAQIREAQHEQV